MLVDSFNWKDSLVSEMQVKLMRMKRAYEGLGTMLSTYDAGWF